MKVAFCSAEVAPFAKVGGLADVAGSLPKALVEKGHDVTLFMPAYGMVIADAQYGAKLLRDDLLVRVNAYRLTRAKLWEICWEGLRIWLIDGDGTFEKVEASPAIYSPSRDDYLFFSRAVMEACESTGWMPDVVSAHDWHMGLIPVMIRHDAPTVWRDTATTFTIHRAATRRCATR